MSHLWEETVKPQEKSYRNHQWPKAELHKKKIGFQKGDNHQQDENREALGIGEQWGASGQGLTLEREMPGSRPGQWNEGEERDEK